MAPAVEPTNADKGVLEGKSNLSNIWRGGAGGKLYIVYVVSADHT